MVRGYIIGILVASLLFLSGCSLYNASVDDISEATVVCNEPYIRVGVKCCLDENKDKICDHQEYKETPDPQPQEQSNLGLQIQDQPVQASPEPSNPLTGNVIAEPITEVKCKDECSYGTCDGYKFLDCIQQNDGCNDLISKGITVGECQVQCKSNSDCSSNQECQSYRCVNKAPTCVNECSTDKCEGIQYFACEKGSDGCYHLAKNGVITKGRCDVECVNDGDCAKGETCYFSALNQFKTCVPSNPCGDGICDFSLTDSSKENCNSCQQDCGCVGVDICDYRYGIGNYVCSPPPDFTINAIIDGANVINNPTLFKVPKTYTLQGLISISPNDGSLFCEGKEYYNGNLNDEFTLDDDIGIYYETVSSPQHRSVVYYITCRNTGGAEDVTKSFSVDIEYT